ncbi:MAG TPA: patatin-like phospholipase family protein [Methylibium sp.]|nr:patatin-like phospholipase family protein [Methylibium sp.]
MHRLFRLCALALLLVSALAQAAEAPKRPRIGLVLSGGGARGLAHVGVLKVLERERVPIDVIAGTSMGAIIGGLYASGMRADELERELLKVDWDELFASRVARRELSQRRKELDFELSSALEIGLRDGEFRVPLGTVSSRGLESLLRRYTLPVRAIGEFDRLPIPFRAVATDMETGKPVVLDGGDLALALRSSMSVPGVFAPTELDGRILGDGGLVDNLPIDVVRAMGADVVIAVNVGTPLAGRETLDTLVGVTAQMINILTEQNVQRSLATLTERDLLIAPPLGELTAADFKRTGDLVGLGRLHAESAVLQMARYALDADAHADWAAARARPPQAVPPLEFVAFEGTELTHPERHAPRLESRSGKPFDAAAAERDVKRLAATGDYTRVDYQLVRNAAGDDGLVFSLEEKSWGPNYFRIGLALETDFSGRSNFNITVAHQRRWLDAAGTEWRNVLQIGGNPTWITEWYHPLGWTTALGSDWFLAPAAQLGRSEVVTYLDPEGPESGRLRRTVGRVGIDLGQPWGEFGELRLGVYAQRLRDKPLVIRANVPFDADSTDRRELGLRLRAVIDQLDYVAFPQAGYRLVGEVAGGRLRSRLRSADDEFLRIEASGELAATWDGAHTLNLYGRTQVAGGSATTGLGLYTLGGFQNLSGYEPGQVQGNYLAYGRLGYYYRLAPPALTRGFFAGASLEAGNVWSRRRDASLGELRYGSSLFLGADTGLGPLYFGVVYAPRGDTGLYLFLGRP